MFDVRNNELYLEEDCDAGKFVAAYEAKYGFKPRYREHFANRSSKIRSYRPNNGPALQCACDVTRR